MVQSEFNFDARFMIYSFLKFKFAFHMEAIKAYKEVYKQSNGSPHTCVARLFFRSGAVWQIAICHWLCIVTPQQEDLRGIGIFGPGLPLPTNGRVLS
jgi:hypothetical protein